MRWVDTSKDLTRYMLRFGDRFFVVWPPFFVQVDEDGDEELVILKGWVWAVVAVWASAALWLFS